MENLIVFILNVLVQSVMYTYFSLTMTKLFSKEKCDALHKVLATIFIIISLCIIYFLKSVTSNGSTAFIVFATLHWLIVFAILKNKAFTSLIIIIFASILSAITELIIMSVGLIIFKTNALELTNYPYKLLILLVVQTIFAIILTKLLYIFLSKRPQILYKIDTINTKQLCTFIIALIICIFPQMILFVINDYNYPPILLITNCLQFIIVCIFIFSYLKKSIEHEKVQSDLFTSELHNKTLVGMVDGVRTLKHDYNNIMQALNGYVSTKQYDKLQEHINQVLKECNVVNNLSVIDPKIFNDPAIYGIVGSKFFIANKEDITFEFDVTTNIAQIQFPMPNLSRILGILLDNAIEATRKANSKYVRLEFKYDKRKCADIIKVINTYDTTININLNEIYNKGFSTKEVKSGIGLWEVKKLVNKNKNSQIYATIENNKFVQNLIIEKVD